MNSCFQSLQAWGQRLGFITSLAVPACSHEVELTPQGLDATVLDVTVPQDTFNNMTDRPSIMDATKDLRHIVDRNVKTHPFDAGLDVVEEDVERRDSPLVEVGDTTSLEASSDVLLIRDGGTSRPLTYYHDVKPIFDARCVSCHGSGGIMSSLPWDNYRNVYDHRISIGRELFDGSMPPWPPSPFCGPRYRNDLSLTPAQISTVFGWIAMGALEGSPSDRGEPLTSVDHTTLSRVDRSLALPPYVPPRTEEYRCFIVDWPVTEAQYITGMQVNPGVPEIVHHALIYKVEGDPSGPGYADFFQILDTRDPGPGFSCNGTISSGERRGILDLSLLGAWAPGNQGMDFPEGTGLSILPRTRIVAQVHYNTTGVASTAMLRSLIETHPVQLNFRVAPRVSRVAELQYWTNADWVLDPSTMLIPARSRGVTHSYAAVLGSGTVYGLATHQHRLGRSNQLSRVSTSATGETTESCLLDIWQWDPHWQDVYWLQTPVRFGPTDRLRLECRWNNPTSRDVSWGDSFDDEMCLGFVYFVPEGR